MRVRFDGPPTLMEKEELEAAYRISHAEMRSTPRPITWPCTAAITGNGARSGAAMACWKATIFFRVCMEALALSLEVSVPSAARTLASFTVDRSCMPTVNDHSLKPPQWSTYSPIQR